MIEFEIGESFSVPPEEIYKAWLSSAGHTQMTGSPAKVSARVNGKFEAWQGYISGKNLELEPGRRIRQAWRTSEFGPSDEDSVVEILLEPIHQGTKVTIRHSHLPDDGEQYRQGWIDFYFTPMKQYFQR